MVRILIIIICTCLGNAAFGQTPSSRKAINILVLLNERGYNIVNGIDQTAEDNVSCEMLSIACQSPYLNAYDIVSIKTFTFEGLAKELDFPYLMAVHKETQECFKLSGFEQNDIVYFLQNVKETNGLTDKNLQQVAAACSDGFIDFKTILELFTNPKHEYECQTPFRYWTVLRRTKDKPTPYVY